jgi:peptidylprolyl isomerase
MKHTALILMLAASGLAASAQTPAAKSAASAATATAAKPAVTAAAARPAVSAAKPATTAKPVVPAANPLIAPVIKAPATLPPVKGLQKPIFTVALRYQEIKVGTGPAAELNKLFKVHYTGYRAADGVKFDSSYDRPGPPLKDKDGKPVLGDDGKTKLDVPQPAPFPQGTGAFITGFDQGVIGMKKGGQRRIFIPWQLGYGTRNLPDRPGHPGIPAKSDLIFDVELVDVTDIPAPPVRPNMPMGARPMPPNGQQIPPRPGTPGAPGSPIQLQTAPKPPVPPAPGTAPNAAAPATPAAPPVPTTAPTPPAPPAASTTAPATPQPK